MKIRIPFDPKKENHFPEFRHGLKLIEVQEHLDTGNNELYELPDEDIAKAVAYLKGIGKI